MRMTPFALTCDETLSKYVQYKYKYIHTIHAEVKGSFVSTRTNRVSVYFDVELCTHAGVVLTRRLKNRLRSDICLFKLRHLCGSGFVSFRVTVQQVSILDLSSNNI